MTTNSTAKLLRGAVNCGEVLRTCFHLNFYMYFNQTIYSAEISMQNKQLGNLSAAGQKYSGRSMENAICILFETYKFV